MALRVLRSPDTMTQLPPPRDGVRGCPGCRSRRFAPRIAANYTPGRDAQTTTTSSAAPSRSAGRTNHPATINQIAFVFSLFYRNGRA